MKGNKTHVPEGLLFSDFIPNIGERITPSNFKWRALPQKDRQSITSSWETAFNNLYDTITGQRRRQAKQQTFQSVSARLDRFEPVSLNGLRSDIVAAVERNDSSFFIHLGENLRRREDCFVFGEQEFFRHRLALFLIHWWISWKPWPSPPDVKHETRGLSTFVYGLVVCGACYLLPDRRKSPGLCFFSFGALTELSRIILKDSRISRDNVIKTVKRLGLRKCPRRDLIFSHIVENDSMIFVY